MSDKKYYWLKLKENFFNADDMKIIHSRENGAEYIIFWQKLLLKAITQEEVGLLRYKENIPYNPEILATVTDTNIDHVKTAMQIFEELNMIEIKENGDIWVDGIQELIGTETTAAARMRKMRGKKEIKGKGNKVTPRLQKGYIEKEIDTEKEIEINNKEQRTVCDNSNLKGTIKNWCSKMKSRYCPDENYKQCMEWFNEYRKWLDVYMIEKKIIKMTELVKFKKSNKYFPILENQMKNWMEHDNGMPAKIKVFRETIKSLGV